MSSGISYVSSKQHSGHFTLSLSLSAGPSPEPPPSTSKIISPTRTLVLARLHILADFWHYTCFSLRIDFDRLFTITVEKAFAYTFELYSCIYGPGILSSCHYFTWKPVLLEAHDASHVCLIILIGARSGFCLKKLRFGSSGIMSLYQHSILAQIPRTFRSRPAPGVIRCHCKIFHMGRGRSGPRTRE